MHAAATSTAREHSHPVHVPSWKNLHWENLKSLWNNNEEIPSYHSEGNVMYRPLHSLAWVLVKAPLCQINAVPLLKYPCVNGHKTQMVTHVSYQSLMTTWSS